MAALTVPSETAVVYGFEEAAGVRVPVRAKAMLKSEHRNMFTSTLEEDVAQRAELRNGR